MYLATGRAPVRLLVGGPGEELPAAIAPGLVSRHRFRTELLQKNYKSTKNKTNIFFYVLSGLWGSSVTYIKETVLSDTELHCSFWKIYLVLSAEPLMVFTFFYFVVPEIFKNLYLNCFFENTNCAALLKAVQESLFCLTDFAVRALAGFFSKPLVYCESGFRKPLRKFTI
jgi:hypothetical protein